MPRLFRAAVAPGALVLALVVTLAPGGYLQAALAQVPGFLETFDGAPPVPTDYANPHNWDIFAQGFNAQEPSLGQHGPNCEPPGFPYTPSNTHPLRTKADMVYLCNNHVMTSPGITGYGAVYMTPPALMNVAGGTAVLKWDMSTLRTSARDWVAVVLSPYNEHQLMAYNNTGFHAPPDNLHVLLVGGGNGFQVTQRVGGGTDVLLPATPSAGSVTWDTVQAAQVPPLTEDAARRDTFEVDLSTTHIKVCITGNNTGQVYTFQGQSGFCWVDADLPTPLATAVWNNQVSVQLAHHVYNAEKDCSDVEDSQNIVHNPIGDAHCPPDTWHWDNVNINPAVPFSVIKPTQDYQLTDPSPQTVTFQQPAPPNTNLEFVTFGANSQLQVSFDGGANWQAARFQPELATGHDENGEMVWMPVPAGVSSVMVRGANGFWGTYESFGFNLLSATPGVVIPQPTPTPPPPPSAGSGPLRTLGQPARIADTRTSGGPIPSGGTRCFGVAGQGGVPADAAGVALNVTAVGQTTDGWLSVYPAGQAVPATSTLNFTAAEYAIATNTLVRLGGGQVCVALGTINGAPGSAQVALDVTGYVPAGGQAQVPLLAAPQRLVDTRQSGGPLAGGSTHCFTLAGVGGVPSDASAVMLTVTATGQTAPGWLSLYPAGQAQPRTSTLDFDTGTYAVANGALVRLGAGGEVCVFVGTINGVPGSTQVVLDATGYVATGGQSGLVMLSAPQRVIDTRLVGGLIVTGSSRCFAVANQAGIPANAAGVIATVAATGYGSNGWLTVSPSGQAMPATSTLNFGYGYAIANGAVLGLGSGGQVCVGVNTPNAAPGFAQVIVDVLGYLMP